jgi:cellulose synthase/poly-beta-1,6-N-acetylglucosamine synthase-like glycosyltransferase
MGDIGVFASLFYLSIQVYLTFLLRRHKIPSLGVFSDFRPQLFVACRNEAAELPAFIGTLDRQTLPFAVVWGDDASTDESPSILQEEYLRHPEWKLYRLPPEKGLYAGKQAVLVALEKETSTEVLFYADADMRFPPTWGEGLYKALITTDDMGGVCGPSLPRAKNLWEGFQRIEWASTLYLIAASQARGTVVTAIGNSLALRKAAWQSIGGWRSLPPTLVEDYELLQALQRAGWRFAWVFHPMVMAETRPEPSLRSWIHQRLRWRKAVQYIPPIASFYWIVQSFLPWVLLWSPSGYAGVIWLIGEVLPLWRLRSVLRVQKVLRYLPLLLAYRWVQGLWFLWLRGTRQPVEWRGRRYPE